VSREETQAYCYQHQLKPRIDSSNLSLSQLRNRLRAELIPLLQSYNPKFNESLLRTAYLAKDELDFFQQQLTLIWDEAVVEKDAQIAMDIRVVESLHPALQRCLIREVLRKVLGDLKDIELKHIEEIRKGLKLPPGKKLSLPRGLSVESRPEKHLIIRKV
jgi:tRNA(Ile)-lysidine synthase